MKDLTMRILLLSGVVSLILGATLNSNPALAWIDGFAIIIATGIVAVVTGINDFEKQKKFNKLNKQIHKRR
jgi:uncharacterized membrane protein HdeD (DUF308 family)